MTETADLNDATECMFRVNLTGGMSIFAFWYSY